MKQPRLLLVSFLLFAALLPVWAAGSQEPENVDTFSIGVFVPGVVEGSPTYELLVLGVEQAVADSPAASMKVVEGGFNQALWEEALTSMAASGEYDLIVSSNPEMPDIVANVLASFPDSRFLLMDAYMNANPQVHSVMFNQREQAFLAGYFAGLVGQSDMVAADAPLRAGLLAGQEYPIMTRVILPGFELGLRSVDPEASVDFRVLGNWYDAGRAAELANSMYATGSHIILTIAGGGNQGVIASARDRDRFVIWYDTAGLSEAPGIVIGSTFVALDRATRERTAEAISGTLTFGDAEVLGVADGYVGFVDDGQLYQKHVEEGVRDQQAAIIGKLQSGELSLEMPLF